MVTVDHAANGKLGRVTGTGPLDLDEGARVAEIFRMFGDSIAVQTGMAGILHQIDNFLFAPLFPQFADMQPMSCRVFAFGFDGYGHKTSGQVECSADAL